MSGPGGGNIKVVVRVRPFNSREHDRKAKCVVSMNGTQTTISPPVGDLKPKNNKAAMEQAKTFNFDHSYWSFERSDKHFAGQDNVFTDLGKPLLDNAFGGYNNCIFAYGQTGSGKSYSMMGYGAEAGVIPRICREMFDRIDKLQQDKNTTCSVEVSYIEIYNEKVRDLLNPANKGNLKVREHPSTGPYVEDLAKLVVRSNDEIESLMDEGNKARTVAATNMNETSSRSHAVFTLTLTQKKHDEDTKMDAERVAKISLVDLAGSERANSTGATGARLKEGAEINRSLSTLGRVIAALADLSAGKKKNASMIPYRDSVLTWLLKDSLGGNSMTAMIAAISPADINFEETLSTLRYADSAKRIKQHAVVNEDANARMIRELKEELAQLRAKLGAAPVTPGSVGGGNAGMLADQPHYSPDTPFDQQMVTLSQPDGTSKQVSKAEIADQLSQSEKLYSDLNQTWEQKMQKTEEIHKEREAALEDLGISIEKGFVGVSTPKKMPHLVNLSDDPLLAECLVYNLKPGKTTVGNDEITQNAEIRLKGSKILLEHCIFENEDGVVSVLPSHNAAVMVNGLRIEKPKRLHSGFRIILGDFHIFRFNHPQEAAKERAEEGSRLKESMTANELDSSPERPRHERSRSSISRLGSQDGRTGTPGSSPAIPLNEGEYDWSFARREAAGAILGQDQNISNLTDEQLDVLFDDLQKVRATRRLPAETRIRDSEDEESVSSVPSREKHLSTATSAFENFSLDTALTTPSTPPAGEDGERIKMPRHDLQLQLEKQRDEYQNTLKSVEESHQQVEEMRQDKAAMEQSMQALRAEMQKQKEDYERQLQVAQPTKAVRQIGHAGLDSRGLHLAQHAMQKWRQRRYVKMAGQMLQHASKLKEAQILSQQMGKAFAFQFAIVDTGQTLASSYDMVLNGVSDESDEDDLHLTPKPCLAIRIADFKRSVLYLWSVRKLERRLVTMRQMLQYRERPEYIHHFKLDDPFSASSIPQFSRIGEAQVSLSAVFESRVQDFTVDVISPYTFNVTGILKLSLEPSLAEAPEETLKFNVVLHELVGFPELEGTDVHAQMLVTRVVEEGGVTTTQLIQKFHDGPIRFDSLHGLSLPSSSSRRSNLRISIFARVTQIHLDKLMSWDDMQDATSRLPQSVNGVRVHENEYRAEEKHDVLTRVQILELSEAGEYSPVDVVQTSTTDPGAYQLHQGLQRRIMLSMNHSCGAALPCEDVTQLRIGSVQLMDASGQVPTASPPQPDVDLKLLSPPSMLRYADTTTDVKALAQWDSSQHASLLLDRPTNTDKFRVQITLRWCVFSPRLSHPLEFSHNITLQVRARSFIKAPPLLSQLWNGPAQRLARSTTGIFVVTIKASPIEFARDLWRMDTQYEYVKGEEVLTGWTPRGVSLVRQFIQHRRRQFHAQDVETTKSLFSVDELEVYPETSADEERTPSRGFSERQRQMLLKYLHAWKADSSDPGTAILLTGAYDSRSASTVGDSDSRAENSFMPTDTSVSNAPVSATVQYHSKNPSCTKSGHLLMPDPVSHSRWVRRYLELRKPYIHVHSMPDGEEITAINLSGARLDHRPQIAKLLQRGGESNLAFFAIYAREKSWVFATRSDREKVEWCLTVDDNFLKVPPR
ncbi:MAG: hypothetical protein Q9162_003268 [Coniocarpon cinnabarinum]